MQRHIYKGMFLLVMIFVFMEGIPRVIAGDITIMTEEWPPYNYTENGKAKGFSVEIVHAIMNELKINYKIIFLPGARGKMYLQSKSNHMLFSIFRTKEREKMYKWIGPISEDSIYFYKKKGNPLVIKTLDDAKKCTRIAIRHEGMVKNFLKKEGFKNLIPVTNPSDIIKKVIEYRFDLLASATPIGIKYKLRMLNYPADALEQTPVKLFSLPLYIACSKEMSDSIIEKGQEALKKIKVSGVYDQIFIKYMN